MTDMAWLRASGFLLLSLLLARPLCNHLARWLVYLLFGRGSEQQLPKGTSKQSQSKLQVIIAGFPRTGTLSLLLAMETLGFPCFHGMHLKKPTTGNLFIKAFTSGDPKCWEELLDGYAAITDFPGACGYKQLMEIFPNAKIILNIRDPNKWYDSFYKTLVGIIQGHNHLVFKFLTPTATMCLKVALYDKFSGKFDDRETCVKAYVHHVSEVKEKVPPHKLLVYDIEKDMGWLKLCEFLNVPIPIAPFPRINDTSMFNKRVDDVARIFTMVLSLYVAIVSCVLFYLQY